MRLFWEDKGSLKVILNTRHTIQEEVSNILDKNYTMNSLIFFTSKLSHIEVQREEKM